MKRAEIAHLLPGIFQRTLAPASPLDAILSAMETLHARAEEILDQLDAICDSHRTFEDFVPFLAHWVDLERIFTPREETDNLVSTGLGRLRELVRGAAYLSKWRGTKQGLQRFLETATGISGFLVEEPQNQPFHLRVTAPKQLKDHRALLERIVNAERPIYATWEVRFE